MKAYIDACNDSNVGGGAMASMNYMASQSGSGSGMACQSGGTNMASMNYMASQGAMASQNAFASHAAPALSTKGYRAATPNQKQSHDQEVFVAESTSYAPSGGMALCGMPIKGNKKPQVCLNDDGTVVAKCTYTDRCCRCSMPVGSYFDHTCPRCDGIVCLACLDDIKLIVSNYRCPCCGDQHYNEEALKHTLWYISVYRNAQRAVGAVPVLFAGLFGYGPEGKGGNAKDAFRDNTKLQEEFMGHVQPLGAVEAPAPAPKAKPAAKGPPPAPPKPKVGAARPGQQAVPEYHTQPPPGWAEGAGAWRPGQAGGSPDPSTVAAALHKAAAAQQQQASGGRRPSDTPPVMRGQSGGRAPNPFASASGGQSPFHTRVPPGGTPSGTPMR